MDVEFETGLFMALLQLMYLQSGLGREHKTTGLRLEDHSFEEAENMHAASLIIDSANHGCEERISKPQHQNTGIYVVPYFT